MALSENCLTTIATMEGELGIASGAEDAYLTRLIEAATKRIEGYCNRVFKQTAAIAESCKGYGTPHLVVARPPITSIASITYDDATVSSDDYKILDAQAGIIYNAGGWYNTSSTIANIESDPVPGTEDILYVVTYKGGWVTPAQTGTRDLPYDIEQACIELVVSKYRSKGRDPNITSESLMSAGVGYRVAGADDQDTDLPASIKDVLRQYRRVAIA